jgi:hypothetical protein
VENGGGLALVPDITVRREWDKARKEERPPNLRRPFLLALVWVVPCVRSTFLS